MTKPGFLALMAGVIVTGVSACVAPGLDVGPATHNLGIADRLDAEGNLRAGKVQLAAGHYGLALKHLRKADRERPDDIAILNAIAVTYDRMQQFDQAQRIYVQALALDPDSVQTLNNYGYSLMLAGHTDLAATLLAEAHDAGQSGPLAATVMGNLLLLQSRIGGSPVAGGETAGPGETGEASVPVTADPERSASIVRTGANLYSLRMAPAGGSVAERLPVRLVKNEARPARLGPPPPRVADAASASDPAERPADHAPAQQPLRPKDRDLPCEAWAFGSAFATLAYTSARTAGGPASTAPSLPASPVRGPQLVGLRESPAKRRKNPSFSKPARAGSEAGTQTSETAG